MSNLNDVDILTFKEAVKFLNISNSTLYKLTSKRAIGFCKPNGGKIYFKKEDLIGWLLNGSVKTKEDVFEKYLSNLKKGKNGKKTN